MTKLEIDPRAIFRLVDATAACVNALAIIAAPIVLMRSRKEAERKRDGVFDVAPQFEAFLAIVEGMSTSRRSEGDGPQLVALAEAVRKINERMAAFGDKRNNVDRAIIEAARAALAAYGLAVPPEGWDAYRGPKP